MRGVLARAVMVVLAASAIAACGDDGDTTQTGAATSTTAVTTSTTSGATSTSSPGGTATTPPAPGGIDTMPGAGTAPVEEEAAGGTALLTDVRVGRHEGFDRVVFEFRGPAPGYRVEYVQPPIREDGSGNTVQVGGNAFLQVTMRPASGFDLTGEGTQVYQGPRRLSGSDAGTSVIREVVRTGDFEAVLGWVIGLSDRVDFRVERIADPGRIVVDVRNH